MGRSRDAFGMALLAHVEGRSSKHFVERDDGYLDSFQDAESYFAGYPEWRKHEREAVRLARGRVLDVGCGAGRVALHLQRRGLRVTGMDNSPLCILVCHRRGARDARVMPFESVGGLGRGVFDTVVMFGNNFGLMRSRRWAGRLLRTLHRITRPGAIILAGANDPHTTRVLHRRYHAWNRRRGRMPGQIRIRVRFLNVKGPWFDYLMVSRKEMTGLVRGTGWKVRKFIGSGGPAFVGVLEKND